MKQTKFWLTTIAALLCSFIASAHDFEVDGIYYNITGMTVEVTFKGEESSAYDDEYRDSLEIPSSVTYTTFMGISKTYRVTSIGKEAFKYCDKLTSITIPKGITSIGSSAFSGCRNLNNIIIPTTITSIEDNTFEYCNGLTSITIPAGIVSIGNSAFSNCSSLTTIFIPNSTTSIGKNAFSGCKNLASITIPDGITLIGNNAFEYTPWYNNLPDGEVYIGKVLYAYKGSMPDSTSIKVKEGTKCISGDAFKRCEGLISITIPGSVVNIGNYAFFYCNGLKEVIIEDGAEVLNLGYNEQIGTTNYQPIFYDCPLERVYWGRNLNYTYIGLANSVFANKKMLHSITIGNHVSSIEDNAFSNCSALTTLSIPKGVTTIGNGAFDDCRGLREVVFEDANTTLSLGYKYKKSSNVNGPYGQGLFYDCPLKHIYLGRNLDYDTDEYAGCSPFFDEYGNRNLSSVTIGESVTHITSNLFYSCLGISSITIPKDIVSIGESAFQNCENLFFVNNYSNLDLSKGSSEFGYVAYYAKKVLNVKDLSEDGDFLFRTDDDVHYLTSYVGNNVQIELPNNFNGKGYHIDDYALYDKDVTSLTISSGVLSIGNEVIKDHFVKTIWLTNTPPEGYENIKGSINYVSNEQYSNLNNVRIYPYLSSMFEVDGVRYVPVSPSERTCHAIDCAYNNAASIINVNETTSFKGVEMKVAEIMPYTFYDNDHIKELSVSHMGNIGGNAFQDCDSIQSVVACHQGNIGTQAFYECDGIKTVIVSNNGDIEEKAFYNCDAIETVDISNQGNVGSQAFYDCVGIKSVVVSNQGNIGTQAFYECTSIKSVDIHNQGDVQNQAFYGCIGIETAVVANKGIVNDEAFSNCTVLKTVTLGDSVGSLGEKVFQQCTSLQEIAIPDYVKSVGVSCFSECSAMKSAVIGSGLTNVKEYTFENCTALTDVTVGNCVNTINSYAFSGCSALTNVSLGQRVATINDYAFLGCSSLPEITLPQSVTKVGNYVFSGCSKLADVIIADRTRVLTLGSNDSSPLFVDCPLDSVYIGGKITYGTSSNKGYSPFYRNTSLRTVVVTDTEEQIYENEFYGCTNLKNVAIGNGVKSIGDYAFSGCSSLNEFSFGSNLEKIGAEAFSDCANLTTITSHAAVPPICGSQALDDINKWSCVLRVPQSYATAYQAADQWKEFFFIEDVVEVKKYALTYMVDGEVYYTDSLAHKETITTIAEPVKEGYTFSGWNKTVTTMPAEDVVINGTFTINTYKVEYVVDGETYRTDEVAYNDTLILVEEPTKEGHTFSGWSEAPETMPANDITISGTFAVNSYLLTYTVDGETVQTDSVAYGTAITLLDEPTKEGHTFSGWSEAPETMPASDVLISGAFTVNKYLVTFKIGDEVIAADSLEYGTTIVAPEAPEKEGYTFDGWGEVAETVSANDVTYVGTYTVNIYKVYYYVGEELVHTVEVAYGEAIPEYVYEPTEEGYTFLGWMGDTYEIMPAHDVTYTANIDDAIEQLTIHNSQLTIYDLSGRKVLDTENLKGGIYIVNGHKVIVK